MMDQRVVDRLFELAAVDDQFRRVTQDVRGCLGNMFPVLVAALAHDVEEQHAALPCIDHIFHGLGDEPRHGIAWQLWVLQRHRFNPSTGTATEGCSRAENVDLGQSRAKCKSH
jgi:hypothetical protein